MRKEIEVKAKAADLDELARKLEAMGCVISEPLEQRDSIFFNIAERFDAFVPGANFLRIRETGGKIFFTLKQAQANELDALEREVEVNDAEELKELILLLGFKEGIHLSKIRRKTNCRGYEICLDELPELGCFIEVEKICENEDAEAVQEELFRFLEELGVSRSQRITHGYDTMVYRKRNNIPEPAE